MATLQYFGEQFAPKVLKKVYQASVSQGITNQEYEGEIKKPGDRVNILSFLNSMVLSDYAVGTDMVNENIIDAEDQLIVEKRKYYNFSLDRLEELFTYAGNIPESLLTDAAKQLEKQIDTYVLAKMGQDTKAGNWIGTRLFVRGSGQTMASLVTTATGGTITVGTNVVVGGADTGPSPWENPADGLTYMCGFESNDLYKGIRLVSTAALVTPFYRISGVTNTMIVTVTEWDEAVEGSDFNENSTLRGMFGGDGITFPKLQEGDRSSMFTGSGYGWEIQAAIATAVTAATIYDQTTLLAEALDENEIPGENRNITMPPGGITMLRQAAELQPTGIAEIYTGTVINGRVMRLGGFDVFSAAGTRVSTRVGRSTATGFGATLALTAGVTGYLIPANHTGMCTYADKWSESRVVDAENQFAKKYQGLFLYGAKVPAQRRKFGALLFGSF